MEYRVKSFLGLGKKIVYHCPGCDQELESPFSEAGNRDQCPMCGDQFTVPVPGEEERLRRQAEEEEQRIAEETQKAERRAAVEEARQRLAAEAKALARISDKVYAGIKKEEQLAQTLAGPGDFAFDAVGEASYQPAIKAALGRTTRRRVVTASLVLEDDNPHDPKAVRIDVKGRVCGYLSRENAREYRKQLRKSRLESRTWYCRAKIVGDGPYGVRVDLPHEGPAKQHNSWRDEPATVPQKAYADDLGIEYRDDITKGELSDLIAEVLGHDEAGPEEL